MYSSNRHLSWLVRNLTDSLQRSLIKMEHVRWLNVIALPQLDMITIVMLIIK
jgi:hypothetical protein